MTLSATQDPTPAVKMPTVRPHPDSESEPGVSSYYNASHLRVDTWDLLKRATERLARAASDDKTGDDARADGGPDGGPGDGPDHGVQGLRRQVEEALALLQPIESYWAFPGEALLGELQRLYELDHLESLARHTARLVRLLVSGEYRHRELTPAASRRGPAELGGDLLLTDQALEEEAESNQGLTVLPSEGRPYFEVLVVDDLTPREEAQVKARLRELGTEHDDFVYDVVVVPTFQDALVAVLFNYNIQTCIYRYSFPFESEHDLPVLQPYLQAFAAHELEAARSSGDMAVTLAQMVKRLRPELDQFLVTDTPVEHIAGRSKGVFRRIFYRQEDYRELHLSILKGISERYDTPFFDALRSYSKKPTGVFHAMPISRGKSIDRSHWIKDMGAFYGANIFLAETSATSGGLDSLLQPLGPLKQAQKLASRAYGSRRTFFVTNGTSTANKIVVQALVRPGDIVLIDRDCHKSHHYGVLLSGAQPVYMDSYPLSAHSMYGAVPLETILEHLRELQAAGKAHKVRMVLLTNCTFDGISYRPEEVMHQILAIQPDMIFLWDEAWFAFASFHPTLRRRTAMRAGRRLRERYASDAYREQYEQAVAAGDAGLMPNTAMPDPAMPDPDKVRVRVYATQSTHKTLTSLRQGSMIQVFDQDFEEKAYGSFHEAYMTHTSTSPNYQILASLDVGRRQVELEGYEMVQKSIELAMMLRETVQSIPSLQRYFRILGPADLIPEAHRPSNLNRYFDPVRGWARMDDAFLHDEFVLDPTRVTLDVGQTGMDGDTFRRLLMDQFDIQINKTSRNSVLFMVHIGTTRGAVAYLIEVLTRITQDLDEKLEEMNPIERRRHDAKVRSLSEPEEQPPLPDFSRFHQAFLSSPDSSTPEGDMRRAFFLAYDHDACEYLPLDGTIEKALGSGREVVSAAFVIPYPPGFPILVPGQVVSRGILTYLQALDVKEIHGYAEEYGLKVFTEDAVAAEVERAAGP